MPPNTSDRYVLTCEFADFEELAEAIHAWDLDFRQLDPGESPAALLQVGCAGTQLAHASFNRRYDQRGAAPPGTRTFGLLAPGVCGVTWCGRQVTDRTLLMFDATGGFEAVSQPGFRVFTFAVPLETLERATCAWGIQGTDKIIGRADNTIELTPSAAQTLRQHMARLSRAAAGDPQLLDRPEYVYDIEHALPGQLVRALALCQDSPRRPALRARQLALQKAIGHIDASPAGALKVTELCRLTGVSERTLEYAFKEHYGMSPKRYLMSVRLDAVHKVLAKAVPGEATVTEIAGRFGFWHMGQFASDYRRMFGRLPSETLQAVRSPRD